MGKAESLRSTALLIHFFTLSSGWSEADGVIRLAFGIAVLSLACGIDVVARYLAIAVILTKVRIQCR